MYLFIYFERFLSCSCLINHTRNECIAYIKSQKFKDCLKTFLWARATLIGSACSEHIKDYNLLVKMTRYILLLCLLHMFVYMLIFERKF